MGPEAEIRVEDVTADSDFIRCSIPRHDDSSHQLLRAFFLQVMSLAI